MEPIGSLQQDEVLKQKKGSVFDDSTFQVTEQVSTEEEKKKKEDRSEILSQMERDLSAAGAKAKAKADAKKPLESLRSVNEMVAESVPEFDKRLKRDFNESGMEHAVENYTIKELLDAMSADTHKKHTEFKQMEAALRALYTLKDDLHTLPNSNEEESRSLDYRDVIRLVRLTAEEYQSSHNRSHLTPWGRERLKISARILDIISQFDRYANDIATGRVKDLSERVEAAEIEETVKSLEIDDTEKGKIASEWIADGDKYREVLKKVLKKEKLDQQDRDTFARMTEDKNRRLIANKATLNMIVSEVPGITLGLSDLETALKTHIKRKLESSDDTKEKLFSETNEFRKFVSDSITEFYDKNKDKIKKASDRKDRFITVLRLSKDESSFYKRTDVNDLILKTGDKDFDFRLSILKAQNEDNEAIIDQVLKDLNFTSLTIDTVREKIRKELKDRAVFGGETEVVALAREKVRGLKYFLPIEAEAERRIRNLMDSYQIPPVDKDAFAKFLAKKTGEPKEIAESYYVTLMNRARTYVSNLKGSAEADNKYSYSYRKLKLREKTWGRIEALKFEMGTMEPSEFKQRLKEIIDEDKNDTAIDLTDPRMSFSEFDKNYLHPHPAREIGFAKRILGDLFLEDKDIKTILSKGEKEYFKEHLLNELAPSKDKLSELEILPSSAIRSVADLLKKNLIDHKDHIKVARTRNSEKVMQELMLKLATSTKPLTDDEIDDLAFDIEESHLYDEKMDKEMGLMVKTLSLDAAPDPTLDDGRKQHFKKFFDHLNTCKKGRYAIFAKRLVNQLDFYKKMMSFTEEKDMDEYLEKTVEKKIGNAIDGLSNCGIRSGLMEVYLDKKFDLIYSGSFTGEVIHFKQDIVNFQKVYLSENSTTAKKLQKNIESVIDDLHGSFIGSRKKKDVSKLFALNSCADAVVSNLYRTKEGIKTLSSKKALTAEIKKAYENYNANREIVEQALIAKGTDPDSIFFGYGTEDRANNRQAYINAGVFFSDLKDKPALMDKEEMRKALPAFMTNFEASFRERQRKEESEKRSRADIEKAEEAIAKKTDRETIRLNRDIYLSLDKYSKIIEETFTRKAIVSSDTGRKNALSERKMRLTRDYVATHLAYLHLDPFLVDCLAEKNVNKVFNKDIDDHARWLYDISDIISKADRGEREVSEDEKRLLIANAYRRVDEFKDSKGNLTTDREIIKGGWYQTFRENYAMLKVFENEDLDFPSLNEERLGISRSLRAILVTGAPPDFQQMAGKAHGYIHFMNEFMKTADKALEKNERYKKEGKTGREQYILSVRQYFHKDIAGALTGENPTFKESEWTSVLTGFASDDVLMANICKEAIYESIGSETYHKVNRNFVGAATGRDKIDELISKKASLIRRRRYKKLSEQEKELFCLGLMMMEKGATGFDSGTVSVLSSSSLREGQITDRLKELAKYIAGEPYNFRVDYSEAFFKLQNKGLTFFGKDKEEFADSAFDKAYEFTKKIGKKIEDSKNAFNAEDKKRAGDGISSIYEAALLGKTQIDDVDELRKKTHTAGSVKDVLLEYAKKDAKKLGYFGADYALPDFVESVAEYELPAAIQDSRIGQLYKENRIRVKMMKRLEKTDDTEILKLIALLQNRSVLDISTKDKSKHVDEDKREELRLMFAEDNMDGLLKNFAKPSACLQALISALSFKIKDEKHLETGRLKKSDFDSTSFDRRSTVDWALLEQAFAFLDELKKESVARIAIRNAPEYIEASGNKKAIDAYHKMLGKKEEKEVGRDSLETFLKEQAEKDKDSKDNKEAKLALAGYNALDDRQKRLFIKVLERRDLLDISKKNLYLNLVSSKRERGFMNETGRFRLIDEYIEKSMRGNEGISLSEDSYKKALKSLLSTQVDDTADFGDERNISKVLAGEKYFVFKRDTAIDWKLFTRALQFVNRASYELSMREGNDELYRAAGRFPEYGKMSMDYSILRRNIHSTGNQFARYGVRRGKKLAIDLVKDLSFGDGTPTVEQLAGYVMEATKVLAPGLNVKLNDLKEVLSEEEMTRKRRTDLLPDIIKGDPVEYVKGKIIAGAEKALTGTVFTGEEIASLKTDASFAKSVLGGTSVKDIAGYIQKRFLIPDEPEAEKRLDSLTEGVKVKTTSGQIRDFVNEIVEGYKTKGSYISQAKQTADSVKKTMEDMAANEVVNTVGDLYSEALALVLTEMTGDSVQGGEVKEGLGEIYNEVKALVDGVSEGLGKADDTVKKILNSPHEITEKVKKLAEEKSLEIMKSCFGKETFSRLEDAYKATDFMGQSFTDKTSFVVGKLKKAKVCVECFADIALSVKNKRLLSRRTEAAESEETQEEDKATLEKAKRVQSEEQQKLTADVVGEHKDLQKLSGKTADTIQSLAIADDVISVLLEVGEEIAEDVGGFGAAGVVKEAIKAGTDFALYVIRCMKDRSMLRTYYTETERGSEVVDTIKAGYTGITGSEALTEEELKKRDVLDIVRQGKGYENYDELVMDTGFKMASSIAYCASKYNPIKQTKIMAVTVMVVLGMKDAIGKTDAATVAGIFDKMKAA